MKYFTLEESAPSEMTLEIIRKIAHTYRVSKNNGNTLNFCQN